MILSPSSVIKEKKIILSANMNYKLRLGNTQLYQMVIFLHRLGRFLDILLFQNYNPLSDTYDHPHQTGPKTEKLAVSVIV